MKKINKTWVPRNKTHGLSYSKFYRTYYQIKCRCDNPNTQKYYLYGGKGITYVWKTFDDFKRDMYQPYLEHMKKYGEKNTTIDRINSSGNYTKENCRWATYSLQNMNRKNGRFYKGLNIRQWAKKLGIKEMTLHQRLYKGWTFEECMGLPLGKKGLRKSHILAYYKNYEKV